MSTLCSLAILLTSGDDRTDLSAGASSLGALVTGRAASRCAGAGGAVGCGTTVVCAATTGGLGLGDSTAFGAAAAGFAPASPMTATTEFTSTVCPSVARI